MAPRIQKLALLAHITFSIGWFGAVVPYLALAIAALTSDDEQMIRAACLSMKFIGWLVIVPFSFAALLTGLVQSLGTRWGLFRYWWVVAKLVLTVFAVIVLWQHMRDVSRVSLMTKAGAVSSAELRPELIHSAGGLLVLLVIMTLSVFKPWGMTPRGRRQMLRADFVSTSDQTTQAGGQIVIHGPITWARIIGFHVIGLFALFVILHITGLHHHH
ncbi:MAG TPA: DUF2269 domain-containing protein [Verrucomicrobiae bacterium]|nr:DUF2269 domain-containing protein [Verrucomicrobiae bacterium]